MLGAAAAAEQQRSTCTLSGSCCWRHGGASSGPRHLDTSRVWLPPCVGGRCPDVACVAMVDRTGSWPFASDILGAGAPERALRAPAEASVAVGSQHRCRVQPPPPPGFDFGMRAASVCHYGGLASAGCAAELPSEAVGWHRLLLHTATDCCIHVCVCIALA